MVFLLVFSHSEQEPEKELTQTVRTFFQHCILTISICDNAGTQSFKLLDFRVHWIDACVFKTFLDAGGTHCLDKSWHKHPEPIYFGHSCTQIFVVPLTQFLLIHPFKVPKGGVI